MTALTILQDHFKEKLTSSQQILYEYQPSSTGSTRSPTAKSEMANGVWKGVFSLFFGCTHQLSLNKFFDPSTPSLRKVDDREKKKKKKCRLRYGHSRGIMQHQHSCQNSCSIPDYVVPKAMCSRVLYTLIVTVLSD